MTTHNKGVSNTVSNNSTGIDSENLYLFNDRGNYGDSTIGLVIFGGDLNDKIATIRTAYNNYLTSLGLTANG